MNAWLSRHQGEGKVDDSAPIRSGDEARAPMNRVVLAPHCDDETLGCGGLLAKYPDECSVVVIATPDEVRRKEFEVAKSILGYQCALFLGLTIYRVLYAADFAAASRHMDLVLGTFNTAVLLTSSLTMALAVRAARTESPRLAGLWLDGGTQQTFNLYALLLEAVSAALAWWALRGIQRET